jgi:hypothetical protein
MASTRSHNMDGQDRVNAYLYQVLATVRPHWQIDLIISGGQTGVDITAIIAAAALEMRAIATMPARFKQRDITGRDIEQTAEAIRRQIASGVGTLSRVAASPST